MKHVAGIILAAGKGTRLNGGTPSPIPKVLNRLLDKPIIDYPIQTLSKIGLEEIIIVVGYRAEDVKDELGPQFKYALQEEQLGTGHAVAQGMPQISGDIKTVLVLNGDDSAFYHTKTLTNLIEMHEKEGAKMSVLSLKMRHPMEYGRILRGKAGTVCGIVEAREATPEQLKIREINTGTYCFNANWLKENIKKISLHEQKNEYYLTDLLAVACKQNDKISAHLIKNQNEWVGINTTEQLEYAKKAMSERLRKRGLLSILKK